MSEENYAVRISCVCREPREDDNRCSSLMTVIMWVASYRKNEIGPSTRGEVGSPRFAAVWSAEQRKGTRVQRVLVILSAFFLQACGALLGCRHIHGGLVD